MSVKERKISPKNLEEEEKILQNLFKNIGESKSTIFNAGAGAGKTYSLVECLREVIDKYGNNLKKENKKIICITYTNVAKDEIKERLGNTELILISTIHERMWNWINNKLYQSELVKIHREYLEEKIEENDEKLNEKYSEYYEQKDYIREKLIASNLNKDELNSENFIEMLKSKNLDEKLFLEMKVTKFKKILGIVKKIDKYEKCIKKIDNNELKKIEYTPLINYDVLDKMRISHDTLLEYGYRLIKKFDILKQIIIDSYPYIFIDEYQDTNSKIVEIMYFLEEYSKKIKHNFFLGYFGDYVQNIYSDGVGEEIFNIHEEIEKVNKEYNRRSYNEIIEVSNKIRNDELQQKSIYENADGGTLEFFHGNEENIEEFILKVKEEWEITNENPLHCLILTNELISKYSNFENFYNFFKNSTYYKNNYQQLTTELLSEDLTKLGKIPSLFYKIIDFIKMTKDEKTFVTNIFRAVLTRKNSDENNINYNQLKELKDKILEIRNCNAKTLNEYLDKIFEMYGKENENYDKVIRDIFKNTFENTKLSKESLKECISSEIYDENIERVEEIFSIDINEYWNWYDYVSGKIGNEIYYHTYHSTKGKEFENVVILMENSFGRERNYFNMFFKKYDKNLDELEEEDKEKFKKIRNLLYVSVTRTIKNLKIFYIDDVSEFSNIIEKIFGEIKIFK